MPTAAEFQALHDELRQLGAVFVQAANQRISVLELSYWITPKILKSPFEQGP